MIKLRQLDLLIKIIPVAIKSKKRTGSFQLRWSEQCPYNWRLKSSLLMFKDIRSYIKALLRNIQGRLTPTSIGSVGPTLGSFNKWFLRHYRPKKGITWYCDSDLLLQSCLGKSCPLSHWYGPWLDWLWKDICIRKKIPFLFSLLWFPLASPNE